MILKRLFHSVPRLPPSSTPFSSAPLTPSLISIPPAPAISAWFLPPSSSSSNSKRKRINTAYFKGLLKDKDHWVTVESTDESQHHDKSFDRFEVPFSYFLTYLETSASFFPYRLYLAQTAPPLPLLPDIPMPQLINTQPHSFAHSSLWMGLCPTLTPLHKDPDHNILYQLCATKEVRLWSPEDGLPSIGSDRLSLEDMSGKSSEREQAVWSDTDRPDWKEWREKGWHITLKEGDALFIPEGWWHAVRGVSAEAEEEDDISASVNWWFR